MVKQIKCPFCNKGKIVLKDKEDIRNFTILKDIRKLINKWGLGVKYG